MKKSWLLTFCCACIPGFGQMYYGYMKRGLSLAVWFCGIISVAAMVELGVLALLLPVIWAYAFFDTFNIRALSPEQQAVFTDDFLPNEEWLKNSRFAGIFKKGQGGKTGGIILILFGSFWLYRIFINNVYFWLWENYPALARMVDTVPAIVIGIAVIIVGVIMLRGNNAPAKPELPEANEEVVPFKGDENNE